MTINELFADLEVDDNAKIAQNQLCDYLSQRGYKCVKEYFVPNKGDNHYGYIDVIADKGNERLAIEFDYRSPRINSFNKLKTISATHHIILLRGTNKCYIENGIIIFPIQVQRK